MTKPAQIKKLIKDAKELIQTVTEQYNGMVEHYMLKKEEFEAVLNGIANATLPRAKEALQNISNLPSVEVGNVEIRGESLPEFHISEPMAIVEPTKGRVGAVFWSIMCGLLILVGFVGVGAIFAHLSFEQILSRTFFEEAFSFYSSLIIGESHAAPALGVVVVLAVSGGIGALCYLILNYKAQSQNLKKAQIIYDSAKMYVQQKEEQIKQMQEILSFLQNAIFNLQGAKLFTEEFTAALFRIHFFEGDDFEAFAQKSKETTQHLMRLIQILELAHKEIFSQDDIAVEAKAFYEEMGKEVLKIKEEIYEA